MTSSAATVEHYENVRRERPPGARLQRMEATGTTIDRNGIEGGVYLLQLHFEEGAVSRCLVLE